MGLIVALLMIWNIAFKLHNDFFYEKEIASGPLLKSKPRRFFVSLRGFFIPHTQSFAALRRFLLFYCCWPPAGCFTGSIGRETTGDDRTIAVVVMPQLPILLMTSSR